MAGQILNLNDLFAKQFGYTPEDFKIEEKQVVKKSQSGLYGSYYAKDIMGRDVFMPVTLGDMFLPYCWIRISGSKRIVEENLTERRGSVKELIAMDDYRINIKGFFIGHDGQFPENDVQEFKTLWERNEALNIKCILTDIFLLTPEQGGVDMVVIKDFDLKENQGIEHVKGWEITLTTDQAFELEII
jgi:hypothetical protein